MTKAREFMLDRPGLLDVRRSDRHTEGVPESDRWVLSEPLGVALHRLRMNGVFYSRAELTAPWGMTLPAMGNMWFHAVISGEVLIEVPDTDSTMLRRGDLALVAHGRGHALRSEPGVPAPGILELDRELVSDRYELVRHGGGADDLDLWRRAFRSSGGAGPDRDPAAHDQG
jgi:hypothetical protein